LLRHWELVAGCSREREGWLRSGCRREARHPCTALARFRVAEASCGSERLDWLY
jgi:hypothetical protein